jgi:hypothetical protein
MDILSLTILDGKTETRLIEAIGVFAAQTRTAVY